MLTLAVAAVLAQAAAGLPTPQGAVHPGCFRELETSLADSLPIVAAVDLRGCMGSNKYSDSPETDGGVLRWRDPETKGAYYQYELLGTLANGVHVVRTAESGGGSGVFQSLLFVRAGTSTVVVDGRPRSRQTLTLVGSETLGDRAENEVTVAGDAVTIRRREFRGAQGYGPVQTIVRHPR